MRKCGAVPLFQAAEGGVAIFTDKKKIGILYSAALQMRVLHSFQLNNLGLVMHFKHGIKVHHKNVAISTKHSMVTD